MLLCHQFPTMKIVKNIKLDTVTILMTDTQINIPKSVLEVHARTIELYIG